MESPSVSLSAVSGNHMRLDLKGNILESAGDLEDDEQSARLLFSMLQDANGVLKSSEPAPFTSLTVAFEDYSFVVTVTDEHVLVVKKST